MIRIVIPPGMTWEFGSSESITGPYEMVAEGFHLLLETGGTPQRLTRGEYTLHSDGTWYKTLPYTREEMATMPMIWAMTLVMILNWAKKFVPLFVILGLSSACLADDPPPTPSSYRVQFIVASGKPYVQIRVQSGPGTIKAIYGLPAANQSYTYSNALPFIALEGTAVGTGSNIDFTPSGRWWNAVPIYSGQPTPGVTAPSGVALGGTPDNPSLIDNTGQPINPDTGQPNTTPGSNPGTPGSPGNPYIPITSPGLDPGGGGGSGSIPPQSWTGSVTIINSLPMAVAYRIMVNEVGGTRFETFDTQVLQPGQSHSITLTLDYQFTWSYAPIIDQSTIGIDPVPIVPPTEDDEPQVPGGGITPPNTPTLPTLPGSTDQTGAINRVAEYVRLYGEAARQTGNTTNGNLEKIRDEMVKAVAKLSSIDSKTGSGGPSSGVVTIEGDQWTDIEAIKQNTSGGDAPESDGDEPPALAAPTSDTDIRAGITRLGNSLTSVVNSVGLGDTTTVAPLQFDIPFGGFGTLNVNLEIFAALLNFIRSLMLGLVSIEFVRRLIIVVRGALVG